MILFLISASLFTLLAYLLCSDVSNNDLEDEQ